MSGKGRGRWVYPISECSIAMSGLSSCEKSLWLELSGRFLLFLSINEIEKKNCLLTLYVLQFHLSRLICNLEQIDVAQSTCLNAC